jgi:hypothetical protein
MKTRTIGIVTLLVLIGIAGVAAVVLLWDFPSPWKSEGSIPLSEKNVQAAAPVENVVRNLTDASEDRINELESQVSDLQGLNEELGSRNSELESQLASIASTEQDLDEARGTNEVLQEQVEELNAQLEALPFDPFDSLGMDVVGLGVQSEATFRDSVVTNGDSGVYYVYIKENYPRFVIHRVACDDTCKVEWHPDEGHSVDVTEQLEMAEITKEALATMSQNEKLILASKGINVEDGEILIQSTRSVFLGAVSAGSWLKIIATDNPELGDNVGPTITFTDDSDPWTVDLDGNPVDPTFVPEGYQE